MLVKFDGGSVRETTWNEYATRFVFGGIVTVLAGLIADKFGPAIGGLFLAFPAIFPASASLIEKHERERKQKVGMKGRRRGRYAAGVEAGGAAMGCVGLTAFAGVAWRVLPRLARWETLLLATAVWIITAVVVWIIRRRVL
jgi:hypothetical protein